MSWKITVGAYQLGLLDSVEILRSVEQLSDTATITLPGSAFNQPFDINDKIRRGNAVKIELGYDDKLVTEFEGFLCQEPTTDNGSLVLKCEDGLFSYRKALKNTELKNPTLAAVLSYVNSEIGGFTLNCSYQFTYDKFVINNATGYDVLKKVQEETKANIYLKGDVLHVHPQYLEIFGKAKYDFSVNIETADLKYILEEDRKFRVIVESTGKDGKVIKMESGTTGGELVSRTAPGVTDKASLKMIADQELLSRSYTGYEGSITGWLIPYCDAGYKILISDPEYQYKNGYYYVTEVKTTFSQNGGVRNIKIGKKLSDD